jgi:hypothetical protein
MFSGSSGLFKGVSDDESEQFAASLLMAEQRRCYALHPVGAAEGCDLLILIFRRPHRSQGQKIAAFGSSYYSS